MSATRTQIYLTEEQRRRIDQTAAARGSPWRGHPTPRRCSSSVSPRCRAQWRRARARGEQRDQPSADAAMAIAGADVSRSSSSASGAPATGRTSREARATTWRRPMCRAPSPPPQWSDFSRRRIGDFLSYQPAADVGAIVRVPSSSDDIVPVDGTRAWSDAVEPEPQGLRPDPRASLSFAQVSGRSATAPPPVTAGRSEGRGGRSVVRDRVAARR